MAKPVSLARANLPVDFQAEWVLLRGQARGHQDFTALEVKALYMYGLIYDICQSVDCLLEQANAWPDFYFPAYGILASGVELLGRCVRGDNQVSRTATDNLRTGFHFLANRNPVVPPDPAIVIVVQTAHQDYTIADLVAMRHFTAHGQAANNALPARIDAELLSQFPQLIENTMEDYWSLLQDDPQYCENLATAHVRPLVNRYRPIEKITRLFDEGSAGAAFSDFKWCVNA